MALLLAAGAGAQTGGIIAVRENGRTVYVNNDNPRPAVPATTPKATRHSVLVYWSRAEKRWVPVPPPSPSAMRAARSAAYEVSRYIALRPRTGTSAVSNPNYAQLARGRAVTSAEIDRSIEAAAARHAVDPNLVRAIIQVESNFNPAAVSRKGALGLMQLMPATARQLGVANAFDPEQNVDAGVRHLRELLNSYGGDLQLSLAAYNAGAGAVQRNNGIPPYTETRDYVDRITSIYEGKTPAGTRILLTPKSPIRMFRGPDGVLTITNE
jgi:soluble lytic murein transglycosylase-like protein